MDIDEIESNVHKNSQTKLQKREVNMTEKLMEDAGVTFGEERKLGSKHLNQDSEKGTKNEWEDDQDNADIVKVDQLADDSRTPSQGRHKGRNHKKQLNIKSKRMHEIVESGNKFKTRNGDAKGRNSNDP
eukprot:CAMPEP_0116934664 /NCGR_PEP_ID=MMETSP0467-20121206/29799_1 /TAXON_ID=283647 /ORGANISM="Mesodinium pulex, Strain SPMC105" /LENGTH=128 /DNA_ID=CAMNT_0004615843 /DNA_START=1729 /DNA_END=2115 /DNA_ORIENTATION=+